MYGINQDIAQVGIKIICKGWDQDLQRMGSKYCTVLESRYCTVWDQDIEKKGSRYCTVWDQDNVKDGIKIL